MALGKDRVGGLASVESSALRALRRWVIAEATRAATAGAPLLGCRAVDAVARLVACAGPFVPVVGRNVAGNMRSLGVYSPQAWRDYFVQLGAHFAGAIHMLRCAGRPGDARIREELARAIDQRIALDASVSLLHEAAARGRGAVIMGPHLVNYLLGLARLSRDVPLTIYFRHQKDARRQEAKERWCRAAGIEAVFQPAVEGQPGARVSRIAEVIGEGRVVFVPPDLPRKRDEGVPVSFFGREMYLPAGAAVLAVRTGVPLFMLLARGEGGRQRLVVHGPSAVKVLNGEGGERAAVRQHLQWFADLFEQFLREETALWYFWGDKRWTRALSGSPGYSRVVGEERHEAEGAGGVVGAA
jgi:lauroyl/myristoyl acyltransferase